MPLDGARRHRSHGDQIGNCRSISRKQLPRRERTMRPWLSSMAARYDGHSGLLRPQPHPSSSRRRAASAAAVQRPPPRCCASRPRPSHGGQRPPMLRLDARHVACTLLQPRLPVAGGVALARLDRGGLSERGLPSGQAATPASRPRASPSCDPSFRLHNFRRQRSLVCSRQRRGHPKRAAYGAGCGEGRPGAESPSRSGSVPRPPMPATRRRSHTTVV